MNQAKNQAKHVTSLVRYGAEGAFGVVEKRRFVDDDGHETFVAVKKLKRQDISREVGPPSCTSSALHC